MGREDDFDDERVVVVNRGGNAGIGMMLLGLAIGAGAALLFAPASGQETRERLQREARRAARKARELTDAIGDGVSEGVERTRSTFDAQVERARDAVTSRKHAVNEAIEAGRDAADDTRAYLEFAVADAKRAYAESRQAYREARLAHSRRRANGHGLATRDEHVSASHDTDHDTSGTDSTATNS